MHTNVKTFRTLRGLGKKTSRLCLPIFVHLDSEHANILKRWEVCSLLC